MSPTAQRELTAPRNAATPIITTPDTKTLRELLEFAKTNPVASNRQVDGPMVNGEINAVVRTGTVVVYEGAGKRLRQTIEFQGITFNVPREFQGMKDVALTFDLQPGSFTFENDVLAAKDVKVVPNFPTNDGWYGTDQNGLPSGKGVASTDPNARYLWRRNGEAYIGSVVRDSGSVDIRRFVSLLDGADVVFRVAQLEGSREAAPAQANAISAQDAALLRKLNGLRPEQRQAVEELIRIL
jgi:hypothetical protein